MTNTMIKNLEEIKMTNITIEDLEICKELDKKAMANLFGGFNNAGYETNNVGPRGVIATPVWVRDAILSTFVDQETGVIYRTVQRIGIQMEEVAISQYNEQLNL
ncbi:MAG: hypothetical protein DRI57_31235 [Deltaproteobacteria bacterium]|nr:MAG: hypothetical protein DRI57_31235 [Deltaproteobacteria bacterium]